MAQITRCQRIAGPRSWPAGSRGGQVSGGRLSGVECELFGWENRLPVGRFNVHCVGMPELDAGRGLREGGNRPAIAKEASRIAENERWKKEATKQRAKTKKQSEETENSQHESNKRIPRIHLANKAPEGLLQTRSRAEVSLYVGGSAAVSYLGGGRSK